MSDTLSRGSRPFMSGRRKSKGFGTGSGLGNLSKGLLPNNRFNEADEMTKHDMLVERCRQHDADRFAVLCRMHLLFLLDLSYHEFDSNLLPSPITSSENNCASTSTASASTSSTSRLKRNLAASIQRPRHLRTTDATSPAASAKASLTKECVDCLHQLMDFLDRDANLLQEGIFRKSGKKSRQQELYNLIATGKNLNLCLECPYNAHDCASVLKMFLADLAEPLLTEAHYSIHCQIACFEGKDDENSLNDRRVQSLQLLFLMLPIANRNLLCRLLCLLHRVARECEINRMNAVNLAMMFAPHILCPRKMAPEELRRKSGHFTMAVAFMIEAGPKLFILPVALIRDLQVFEDTKDEAVRTTITFCERRTHPRNDQSQPSGQSTGGLNDTTAVALAELYAHVQSMPESLKKRQLIKQFNKENKKGTPVATASGTQRLKPKRPRTKSLRQSLKKRLFRRNQRIDATVHPIICSEVILKSVSSVPNLKGNSSQEEINMHNEQKGTGAAEGHVNYIRHPAYCRNSAQKVASAAAVGAPRLDILRNSNSQVKHDANNLASPAGYQPRRQPSSSSLVFYKKNPSLLSIGSNQLRPGLINRFESTSLIFRETSL